jgi:hypothetical protein
LAFRGTTWIGKFPGSKLTDLILRGKLNQEKRLPRDIADAETNLIGFKWLGDAQVFSWQPMTLELPASANAMPCELARTQRWRVAARWNAGINSGDRPAS